MKRSLHPSACVPPKLHTNITTDVSSPCVTVAKALSQLSQEQWTVLRDTVGKLVCQSVNVHCPVDISTWTQKYNAYEDIERWCVHVFARMHSVPTLEAFEHSPEPNRGTG